ncbi:YcxB family protein [Sphingosinicella sp. YJ22]|uniref:YcxB family protein n=1 Tax=Sphingosinicella sp. YJ22 TaxID=1104780 RepID=UPI00140CD9D4|nr:YcxB family protein [Sphingosinicella sp. YJ22]
MGRVRFVPSEADLLEANKIWLGMELRKPSNLIFFLSVTVLAALFACYIAADGQLRWSAQAGAIGAALGLVALGLILVVIRLRLPAMSRRSFAQQKWLGDEVEMTWSDDGILFETCNSHARHDWDGFGKWSENGAVFVLFFTDSLFSMIPKRVLAAHEADDLRTRLAQG